MLVGLLCVSACGRLRFETIAEGQRSADGGEPVDAGDDAALGDGSVARLDGSEPVDAAFFDGAGRDAGLADAGPAGIVRCEAEPLRTPRAPGAWRIYPDGEVEHMGDDRRTGGGDFSTSLHVALGWRGAFLPGAEGDNSDLDRWEIYDPPPPGTVIELHGPGLWDYQTADGAQGGLGKQKARSIVIASSGVTIRGVNHGGGDGTEKQRIRMTAGATTPFFYIEAEDVMIENLVIENIHDGGNSGQYAFGLDSYASRGTARRLTVRHVDFERMYGIFWNEPTLRGLTFACNTITGPTRHGLFKNGAIVSGATIIAQNTFGQVGVGRPSPVIRLNVSSAPVGITDNVFGGFDGQYAVFGGASFASPITLTDNDWGTGSGGVGAPFQLFPLDGGGHAVGVQRAGDVVVIP